MNTSLLHLAVSSETDFTRLHSVCLQIAHWAGIGHIEQLYFAFSIIEKCSQQLQEPKEIEFLIAEDKNTCLKVTIKTKEGVQDTIEAVLPSKPDLTAQPSVSQVLPQKEDVWRPEYQDMQHFNYALSHDLKNSLAKLKLALALLEEENIPSNLLYYIDIIHRSSVKLESTMMSLNKIIELGHTSHEVVQFVSPAAIFEEVVEDYSEHIYELQMDFDDVPAVSYIEVYLKSLYSNMLSNAVKYASTERPLIVSVKAWKENETIVLSFTDNGQGIDLDAHGAKIFQPFTRFNNKTEGSGIGLYLVKNMIERNGGRVEVESKINEGTTFRFYLKEYRPVYQLA